MTQSPPGWMSDYPSTVQAILLPWRLSELGPGSPNTSVQAGLESLSIRDLFAGTKGAGTELAGTTIADTEMAQGCLAGLWLYHDFLDQSHAISQELHSTTGSFWHGIMHRREPDSINAAYWFRRVGHHPVYQRLGPAAQTLAQGLPQHSPGRFLADQTAWDPFAWIEACDQAPRLGRDLRQLLRQVALLEWQLLFEYCWTQALGRPFVAGV